MEWVILAGVLLVLVLGSIGLALRNTRPGRAAAQPSPDPAVDADDPDLPVSSPSPPRPDLPDDEQVARALGSHLQEAQDIWFHRLAAHCPRCGEASLETIKRDHPVPPEDPAAESLLDISYRCGACGWRYEREGVRDHVAPHPGHWRPLVGPMGAPRSAWAIGDSDGRPVARLTVGGGQPTLTELAEPSAEGVLKVARTLVETAIRVDGKPLAPAELCAMWRDAVADALPFGSVLSVELVEPDA